MIFVLLTFNDNLLVSNHFFAENPLRCKNIVTFATFNNVDVLHYVINVVYENKYEAQ